MLAERDLARGLFHVLERAVIREEPLRVLGHERHERDGDVEQRAARVDDPGQSRGIHFRVEDV